MSETDKLRLALKQAREERDFHADAMKRALPELTRLRAALAAVERERDALREFAEWMAKIRGPGVQVVGVTQGIRERARAASEKPHG